MEGQFRNNDEMIFDFLDGKLDERERQEVMRLMTSDPAFGRRFEELRSADTLLKGVRVEQPSRGFTAAVMQKLEPGSRMSIRNAAFLLAGMMAVIFLGAALMSAGIFDGESTLDLHSIDFLGQYLQGPLPAIPIDGKMIIHAIILLNVALAFIVLDRAIFKPLFQRRMNTGREF